MKTFKQFASASPAPMSRVVRGAFPDRQFDVDFWQAQGDEAIFEAAWELVQLSEEFKGSSVDRKPDFKDLLRLLNQKRVTYLIWIESTPDNAKRTHEALEQFGASNRDAARIQLERLRKYGKHDLQP